MKRIGLSILTALLVVSLATTVWAQAPSQARGGISTPYVYKYDPATGDRSAYYLAVPTLAANDTLCGLTTTQTLTNKTLTAPVIATFKPASGGPTFTLPAADGGAGTVLVTDGSGTLSFAAGSGVTLDGAYDQGGAGVGRTITVDQGAVQLNGSHATNNTFFINKTAGTGHGMQITNAGTGKDINGTSDLWGFDKTGAGTFTGFTSSGATVNINVNSNFTANINTGTSTGAVSIGGGSNTVAVNSSSWDITTAGAMSGFTSLSLSDDITLANGKAVKSSTTTAQTVKMQAYDVDNTTYRDAITLTNGDTVAVAIGSNNETVAINSSDWDVNATGDMTGIGAITMDGLLTGTLGATVTGAVVNLNASSNFAVNVATGTSTGTVTIGGAANQQIDIGNGAAVKTVSLGSSNTTSTTTISSGSGAVNINASVNNPVNVATGTSTGTVTIGGAGAQQIDIGNGAAAKTVNVGSSNTTSTTTVLSGSGGITLNKANSQPVEIGTGNSTGQIDIGGTGAQTINVGNGAAAKTVALGSSNTTSATTILSGSGTVKINEDVNNAVNIATGTSTGTVTIGGAGAQAIDIGSGAAAKTVTLGSTNTTSTTTINAGSGNINLVGTLATGDAITGDGTAALGGFMKTVTNDADAHTVTAAESGTVLTNAGNDGDPVGEFTLPSAAVGLNYCFVVAVNQELRVIPAAGDSINIAGVAAEAAEYWTANATGESLCIVAIDVNTWVATSYTGTWTQQTPP